MEKSRYLDQLRDLVAEEISAQLGVKRRVDDMSTLIADAILDVFRIEPLVQQSGTSADLSASIRRGYEIESSDPNFEFNAPPEEESDWLGAWLHSEGWRRSASWATGSR